ncbi:MAG: AMP-dependent synthetase/ligase [Myxococcales bacterium]
MAQDTIPLRLITQAKQRPREPAYFTKRDGIWRGTSWADYAEEVRRAAKAMIALGLEPGQNVAMLGFNRPEWTIFLLAAMSAGGAGAGIYATCSPSEVQYIVHHAEAPIVLVENETQWLKIKAQRQNLPLLRHVVLMKGAQKIDDPMVLTWEAFNARAHSVQDEVFWRRLHALKPTGLASLIYTSGTTGPPKAVMLSHANLIWTADVCREITRLVASDSSLSYLPLSHIAEQMFTVHAPVTIGAAIYYAESIEKVPDNLRETQPTVLFGVPRIWEKFHAGIQAKLQEVRGPKKLLLDWARGVARQVNDLRNSGKEPNIELALQHELAKKLVFTKLKTALGLANARLCVSGAAPIAREILEFFASLDIVIHEVYGQSEVTGPTSFNQPGRTRFGSVGTRIPGLEVRIANDGEILVKGPSVFMGYFKDPATTREVLIDGVLHSGDLGEVDADGFLTITGRKKDIIITAGGKNIAPKNIEAALKQDELISEAVVIGDRRKFLTAIMTIDPEVAKQRGVHDDRLHENARIRELVQQRVDVVNRDLARVEQIKRFKVLPRAFGIDSGELTPTLKVKRNKVHEIWAREIDSMYTEEAASSADS